MTSRPASPRRTTARWGAVVVLLAAVVGFAVVRQWGDAPARSDRGALALRQQQVGSPRALAALMRLGKLGVAPDPDVFAPDRGLDTPRGLLAYSLAADDVGPLPSTTFARAALGDDFRFDVVSLALDPLDWRDPDRGLDPNAHRRGRGWERGACLSLFEAGELVAETTLGVCVHGDTSRKRPEKSLRLILTSTYGAGLTASDLLPGAVGETLVLHNDARKLCFVNPIAYEVAAILGCDVPRTRPVRILVNGTLFDTVYFLTEHLTPSHVRQKLGHDDFLFVNEKSYPDFEPKPKTYRSHYLWPVRRSPARIADVAGYVDLDGVLDWLVAVLFCAPYDSRQGVAYLDRRRDGRWRWIAWDMDWSFQPWPETVGGEPLPLQTIVEELDAPAGDLRTALYSRLMADDPEFRRRLLERVRVALDHELSPARLDAILDRYRGIAGVYAGSRRTATFAALDRIAEFLAARPEQLRAELAAHFGLGALHTCTVRVPAGCTVVIDGFPYTGDWHGRFFAGQTLTVAPGPGVARLRVEGADKGGSFLWLAVGHDVEVEAVPQ